MLYTFAHNTYDIDTLQRYWQSCNASDAALFWQEGIIALLKYAKDLPLTKMPIFILEQDLSARNLSLDHFKPHSVVMINLPELVKLTENHTPQLAL